MVPPMKMKIRPNNHKSLRLLLTILVLVFLLVPGSGLWSTNTTNTAPALTQPATQSAEQSREQPQKQPGVFEKTLRLLQQTVLSPDSRLPGAMIPKITLDEALDMT